MSLYTDLKEAGQPVANWQSDLYTPVNPVTKALIDKHKSFHSTFINQVEGGLWYDVAFAFDPFWEAKDSKAAPK